MENFCRDYLLSVARAFAEAEERSLEGVSRQFHGNTWFFAEFEAGKVTLTLRKFDEMLDAFADHWPKNAEWPKGTIKLRKNSVRKAVVEAA